MKTFELAGEAMIQAHEGNRQIAMLIVTALRSFFGRFGRIGAVALEAAPGPHSLP